MYLFLFQCISQRACAIVGYERKAAHELSYKKGDRIVIISQNMERYHSMFFYSGESLLQIDAVFITSIRWLKAFRKP